MDENFSSNLNDSVTISKRRSRYETNGRDFKCQICEKTYLSYPAMYTHMKNKHALDPSGAAFLQTPSRGRGRPKRNFDFTRIDPTTELYLKSEGRAGGPTSATVGFRYAFEKAFEMNPKYNSDFHKHPLYDSLSRFSHDVTPGARYTSDVTNENEVP